MPANDTYETARAEICRQAKLVRDRDHSKRRWRRMTDEEKAAKARKKAQHTATEDAKARRLDSTLRRKFGISASQWSELFERQEKSCAICGAKEPGGKGVWCTDHCHETETLRGILCNGCNSGLGHFRDSIASLGSAAEYLKCPPAEKTGLAKPGAAPGKRTVASCTYE